MLSNHVGHGCNYLLAISMYPPAAYLIFVIPTSTVNIESGFDHEERDFDAWLRYE
jgi:hypothetical protein